ncbi:MAG: membrane-associated phospholipid phosphatase [Myxococcota bacterium]|jgi:membrane-associated phospholipid phosphatase
MHDMSRRAVSAVVAIGIVVLINAARPQLARADAIETSGDVLQFGIPAIALGLTVLRRDKQGAIDLATSGLITEAWVWTLKVVVDKRRPSGGGWGFPSGHSATAAFGAGFVHRRYGFWQALPLYAGTGFVAWSRYDAGAHSPIDLVAGVAIGIATSMVATEPFMRDVALAPMPIKDGFGARVMIRY